MAKFTKQKKEEFYECFIKNDLHLSITCDEIGIHRHSYYYALENDLEFADRISKIESNIDNIIFNYIMEGIKDHNTRLGYLKLMSSQRIDRIMNRGLKQDSEDIVFKLKKSDFLDE